MREEIIKKFREKFVFRDGHGNLTMPYWWPVVENEISQSLQEYGDERYEEGKKDGYEKAAETHATRWLEGMDEAHENGMKQAKSKTLKLAVEAGSNPKTQRERMTTKKSACEFYLDHTPVWAGDGFFCSKCMIEFEPAQQKPAEIIHMPIPTREQSQTKLSELARKGNELSKPAKKECCMECKSDFGAECKNPNCICHKVQSISNRPEPARECKIFKHLLPHDPSEGKCTVWLEDEKTFCLCDETPQNESIDYDNLHFTRSFIKLLIEYNDSEYGSEKGQAIRDLLDFISAQKSKSYQEGKQEGLREVKVWAEEQAENYLKRAKLSQTGKEIYNYDAYQRLAGEIDQKINKK